MSKDFVIENDVLIKYNGTSASVVVPEGVKKIGEKAFLENSTLETITLPSSVEEIGDLAFFRCINLQNIALSGNLKTIGNYAFSTCRKMHKIILPNSLVDLGEGTFSECSNLEDIKFSNKLTKIPPFCFSQCRQLSSFKLLPSSIKEIGDGAFKGCSFKVIKVPSNIQRIGQSAFLGNHILYELSFEKNSKLEKIEAWAFKNCILLNKVSLPPSLKSIENSAFRNCYLDEIKIPFMVTNIGDDAFDENPFNETIYMTKSTMDANPRFVDKHQIHQIHIKSYEPSIDELIDANIPLSKVNNMLIANADNER